MSVIDETHDPTARQLGRLGARPCRVSDLEFAVRDLQPVRRGAARRCRDRRHDLRSESRPRSGAVYRRDCARGGSRRRCYPQPIDGTGLRAAYCVAQAAFGAALGRQSRAGKNRRAGRAAIAQRRRLHDAIAGGDRQLHRFLRRHPPRAQWRHAARSQQSAEPELQIRAGRLSQPGVVGAALGRTDLPAERSAQTAERGCAELWPVPQARLRA